jgi:phosphoglucomutase
MMEQYRQKPPQSLAGTKVVALLDYQKQVETDLATGNTKSIDLPGSNVLQFLLADGSKISARPSGTEPKIKFYFSVNGKLEKKEDYDKLKMQLDKKIAAITKELNLE